MQRNDQKLQAFIQDYEKQWLEMKNDSDFNKILALLRHYCGQSTFLERFNTHAKIVAKVVSNYGGVNYSPANYGNTLLYTPGLLMVHLCKSLSNATISDDGKLAAIFNVIQNHTGINASKCVKYFKQNNDHSKSFIFKDIDYDLDIIRSPDLSHALLSEKKCHYGLSFALDCGLITSANLIKCLIDMRCSPDKSSVLLEYFVDEKIVLNEVDARNLFKYSLNNKQYFISLYLFCKYNSLDVNQIRTSKRLYPEDELDMICYLLNVFMDVIHKPVSRECLLDLIDHMNDLFMEYKAKRASNIRLYEGDIAKLCAILYVNFCSKVQLIHQWSEVEEGFLQYFKLDCDHAFFIAFNNRSLIAIDHLLKTKKINFLEEKWHVSSMDFELRYQPDYCILRSPYNIAMLNACNSMYKHVGTMDVLPYHRKNSANYMDDLDVLELLIKHDPSCIKKKIKYDLREGDIFYHLENIKNKYKENHPVILYSYGSYAYSLDEEFFNRIDKLYEILNDAKRKSSRKDYLTFFCGTKDMSSSMAVLDCEDVRKTIGMFSMCL